MKHYRVVFTQTVNEEIDSQVNYLIEQQVSPERLTSWLNKLLEVIDSLEQWPHRFPVSQDETAIKGFEIRKLVFGNYLVHYRVDDDGQLVEVLSFRHGAQRLEP